MAFYDSFMQKPSGRLVTLPYSSSNNPHIVSTGIEALHDRFDDHEAFEDLLKNDAPSFYDEDIDPSHDHDLDDPFQNNPPDNEDLAHPHQPHDMNAFLSSGSFNAFSRLSAVLFGVCIGFGVFILCFLFLQFFSTLLFDLNSGFSASFPSLILSIISAACASVLWCYRKEQNNLIAHHHERQRLRLENESLRDQIWEVSDEDHDKNDVLYSRSERTKARFLASVSHEMRTPLNGILGMTQLLLDSPLKADQREYSQAVLTSGQSLLSLIDDLLDYTKIEAGQLKITPQASSVGILCEQICELLAPKAHEKGLSIGSYVDVKCPEKLMIDAARLRQVLINLVNNAIKFTHEGGVTLSVSIESQDISSTTLHFEVSDSGIGIAHEDQLRIFKPFEQVHLDKNFALSHTALNTIDLFHPQACETGTGLGLSISEQLISKMGGCLHLQSQRGQGSVFSFSLKCADALCADEDKKDIVSYDFSKHHIRMISPFTQELTLLKKRLSAHNIGSCTLYHAFEDSFTDKETPHPDIIFIDHSLIHTSILIFNMLKRHYKNARYYVMMRPQERDHLQKLQACGFDGYLIRPVRGRSLEKLIMQEQREKTFLCDPAEDPYSIRPSMQKAKILVVEDNVINAKLLCAMLDRMGHSYLHVGDGQKAVETWLAATKAHKGFDLILMDLSMPLMDGQQATYLIHQHARHHGFAAPPIIALTANAEEEERDYCLENGFDAYLTKPLSADLLSEHIVRFVKKNPHNKAKLS